MRPVFIWDKFEGNELDFEPEGGLTLADDRVSLDEVDVPKRVNLDAMIPREDFAVDEEGSVTQLITEFPISSLQPNSPVLQLLRKPDFQRETTHWTPDQVASFVQSFLDKEVIPSLIFWNSHSYIFVLDGGHRLSALRAWIEDDYGDGAISREFYHGNISADQIRVAKQTRRVIEERVGRFSSLASMVGSKIATNDVSRKRSSALFTRALTLQWVYGDFEVAQSSFFKINSQGTPLDESETLLIRNRKKPIAISARAILRAGAGHRYWSKFDDERRSKVEKIAENLFKLLFEPEITSPIKTLDVPLGGSVSPVDALTWLIEFITVAGTRDQVKIKLINQYEDDISGDETVNVLSRTLEIANRITGNTPASLGLHPAVYFYNEKGKHTRFLFLGMVLLLAERVRNNDSTWFKKFTTSRAGVEKFMNENKSLIGIILQNMSRAQRVPKMRDLFVYLTDEIASGRYPTPEGAVAYLGLRGRIIDVSAIQTSTQISDDTKSMIYVRQALKSALKCPICGGLLDPTKSVSYDHIIPVRSGGTGDQENARLVHPYCNSIRDALPHLEPV